MIRTEDARSAAVTESEHAPFQPHYEVWAATPTHAGIVGAAHTLLGALTRYLRARRAGRDCTISVLENAPAAGRGASGRTAQSAGAGPCRC